MSVTPATSSQLLAVVERARRKSVGRQPIIVRANPSQVPQARYEAQRVTVSASRSPLEIRRLAAGEPTETLVVLTDCDHHELGDDLMARIAGGRIWPLDRWETVKELFAARSVSRDLARKAYLADALIESRPLNGYQPVRSGVLDLETALSALLREYLKLPEDLDTLGGFLHWALRRDAAHLLAGASADLESDLHRLLIDRYGPGTAAVTAILQSGQGGDLIPLGLVGGVIHHTRAPAAVEARLRLKLRLDDRPLQPEAWREFGAATERFVRDYEDPAQVSGWLAQSDVLLAQLSAEELAHLSDLIPSGSEQRLRQAAAALEGWASRPDSAADEALAHEAIDRAAQHRQASATRIERMRMAARLIRRGAGSIRWGNHLRGAAQAYQTDGAWLDLARTHVSRGESDPTLKVLYAGLTVLADQQRAADNKEFARFGPSIGSQLPDDVLGIEGVMEQVVASIAAHQPVLVIVLDGMGWPSFLEVYKSVAGVGWTWWRDEARRYDRPVVAVLPTVTEFSRTSLFAGEVRSGTGESEGRAFEAHPALANVSKTGKPPVLHHKASLRSGGLDTIPDALLADIADTQRQVVAVVLNNIDERLKDVVAPPEGWGLQELDPMMWLLSEARLAGRVVVLTADHGHVLDRSAEQVTAPGGGERWKLPELGVAEGELEVSGARVIGSSGSRGGHVILPWVEQRHYGAKRNGYHGGITPQEVLVPLAILSVDDQPEGWTPVTFSDPVWWHHRPKVESPATPESRPATKRPAVVTPTLFDTEESPAAASWLDRVIQALQAFRTPLIRLTDEEVGAMLRVLADQGGMAVSETRLAEISGLPIARIGGYVSQLQQLVNIEGYGVVTASAQEVRLDRSMLLRQLGLE